MAGGKSKAEVEAELGKANDYIEQLEGKLDDIVGIAGDEDEEEEAEMRLPLDARPETG